MTSLMGLPANIDIWLSVGVSVTEFILITSGKLDRVQLGNLLVSHSVEVPSIDLVQLRQLELLADNVLSGLMRANKFTRPNLEQSKGKEK